MTRKATRHQRKPKMSVAKVKKAMAELSPEALRFFPKPDPMLEPSDTPWVSHKEKRTTEPKVSCVGENPAHSGIL